MRILVASRPRRASSFLSQHPLHPLFPSIPCSRAWSCDQAPPIGHVSHPWTWELVTQEAGMWTLVVAMGIICVESPDRHGCPSVGSLSAHVVCGRWPWSRSSPASLQPGLSPVLGAAPFPVPEPFIPAASQSSPSCPGPAPAEDFSRSPCSEQHGVTYAPDAGLAVRVSGRAPVGTVLPGQTWKEEMTPWLVRSEA